MTSRSTLIKRRALVFEAGTGYVSGGGVCADLHEPMHVPGLEPYDEIDYRPQRVFPRAYVRRGGAGRELSAAERHAIETRITYVANAAHFAIERRQHVERRVQALPWTGPERRQGERRGG